MWFLLDGDQRPSAPELHDAHERLRGGRDDHRPALEDLPGHQGPRLRRLLELRAEQAHRAVQARREGRGRQVPQVAGGRGPAAGVPEVHRVLPVPGRLPRPARPRPQGRLRRPPLHDPARFPRDAPPGPGGPHRGDQERVRLGHHLGVVRDDPRGVALPAAGSRGHVPLVRRLGRDPARGIQSVRRAPSRSSPSLRAERSRQRRRGSGP